MSETRFLIDEEHRILVDRIAALSDNADAEISVAAFRRHITQFLEDISDHFWNEEAAMRAFGFPEFERHRDEHCQFLSEFEARIDKLREDRREWRRVIAFLRRWLSSHGGVADAHFEVFLERGLAAEAS